MNHIKLPNFIIIIVLFAFVSLLILTAGNGTALKEIFFGILVYTLYSLIAIGYLLRFVLIFLGVFAFYRILQGRFTKQLAV